MIRKKILLLGDFSVGKTSLIRRYIDKTFDDSYLTTIGVKISEKEMLIDDVDLKLLVWDVEGATKTKKIPLAYFKGASAAIFVADVSRKETMDSIDAHVETFLEINPNSKYIISYNKSDLLSKEEENSLILPSNSFLSSAKKDENIEILFEVLAQEIVTQYKEKGR